MMKFRRITSLSFTTAVILSCMAYAFPYSINNRVSEIPAAPRENPEYISNLASEKANHLFDIWCEGAPYSSRGQANYPLFYGGCYIDDDKYLVIAVTLLSQEVIDYFESLIDLDYVRFLLVRDSYQKLLDEKEIIKQLLCSGAFGETVTKSFTGIGISESENSLHIFVATEDSTVHNTIETVYASNSNHPCKLRFFPGFIGLGALEADKQSNTP